jgi:toxoflavin synthase
MLWPGMTASSLLPTSYDRFITADYANLFDPSSPFNWLSKILEDRAVGMLPHDRNSAVLDLACGVGSFCGRLHRRGFRNVVGTDISASQIQVARRIFSQGPQFEVADARRTHETAGFLGRFDVVNASWLYDTATDAADALVMARSAHACLKPGGRHQGLEVNPAVKASEPFELSNFGIALLSDLVPGSKPNNGQRICADILVVGNSGRTLTTYVTYFDEDCLRSILKEAGFRDITFQQPDAWELAPNETPEIRAKFELYVQTNPEMVSFTAIA